jgi:hypothetical protein
MANKIVVVKATAEETAQAGSYAKYKATCGALNMYGPTAERAKVAVENFLARSASVGQWT